MFLHSWRDLLRLSKLVSQSLTLPPMSTVTTPELPSFAKRTSVSEIVDSQEV